MARWGVAMRRFSVLTMLAAGSLSASAAPVVAAAGGSYVLALEASTPPVVPGYVPFALLAALEAVAVLAWVLVVARRRRDAPNALLLCSRCARLHRRTEVLARGADAAAVGALAFLVALPFVAAGYESGFTFAGTALAASAVAAVIALAAEADFLARAVAARLWPRLTWNVEPGRTIGGGARWLGVLLALVLLDPYAGIIALFGGGGKRLVLDLGPTWTISAAAAILVIAAVVAVAARWLVPLVFNSLPTTLAAGREPHGTSA